MELNDKNIEKAERDRFIDLMPSSYLCHHRIVLKVCYIFQVFYKYEMRTYHFPCEKNDKYTHLYCFHYL